MIKNLQSLRGIAAILIFYHHYGFNSDIFVSFGDFGVVFFMILSGFVLYLSAERKYVMGESIQASREFITGRLLKIYPLYAICWIIAIILLPYSGAAIGKLLGFFALQSWLPDESIFFAGNAISWFISDLIFCYILFIPAFSLFHSRPKLATTLISLYYIVYFTIVLSISDRLSLAIIYINPLMQFANFLLGILLCRLFLRLYKLKKITHTWVYQVSAILLIIACMMLYPTISTRFSFGSYWWLPVALAIVIFAKTDLSSNPISRILHSKTTLMAGELSFCFYMIHGIGINLWNRFLTNCNLTTDNIPLQALESAVLLITLFAISYFINRYFVGNVQSNLKKLLK